jgi:hypothetical protein
VQLPEGEEQQRSAAASLTSRASSFRRELNTNMGIGSEILISTHIAVAAQGTGDDHGSGSWQRFLKGEVRTTDDALCCSATLLCLVAALLYSARLFTSILFQE